MPAADPPPPPPDVPRHVADLSDVQRCADSKKDNLMDRTDANGLGGRRCGNHNSLQLQSDGCHACATCRLCPCRRTADFGYGCPDHPVRLPVGSPDLELAPARPRVPAPPQPTWPLPAPANTVQFSTAGAWDGGAVLQQLQEAKTMLSQASLRSPSSAQWDPACQAALEAMEATAKENMSVVSTEPLTGMGFGALDAGACTHISHALEHMGKSEAERDLKNTMHVLRIRMGKLNQRWGTHLSAWHALLIGLLAWQRGAQQDHDAKSWKFGMWVFSGKGVRQQTTPLSAGRKARAPCARGSSGGCGFAAARHGVGYEASQERLAEFQAAVDATHPVIR